MSTSADPRMARSVSSIAFDLTSYNNIRFKFNNGNIVSGRFSLYGIKVT